MEMKELLSFWQPEYSLYLSTLLIAVFTFVSYTYTKACRSFRPPAYSGWIPFLGCALEFGKCPLYFIEQKRKELGSVFTLCVARERLTFITEPEDFPAFFLSPDSDFQQAVQKSVTNIASVSPKAFFDNHTKLHDTVKGKLAASRLGEVSEHLCEQFNEQLQKWGTQGKGNLVLMVREAMYAGVMNNLFGDGVLPVENREEFKKLENYFVTFDEQFEYGAQLPAVFIREWSTAKQWLLKLFNGAVKKVEHLNNSKKTLFQILISEVDRPHAPNFGLLMLWASLANAIPLTFWTLAFILNNERIHNKLQDMIRDCFRESIKDGKVNVTDEDLKKIPYLKWCILEAVRLRSVGTIARRTINNLQVGGYIVPKGDMLMLSPFWAHRNPKYFEEPENYRPERWMAADVEKNNYLEGFIAFGGGRYQCPGRWYALHEMQVFLVIFFVKFDCKLTGTVPEPSPKHLVGTQQPLGACPVEYTAMSS